MIGSPKHEYVPLAGEAGPSSRQSTVPDLTRNLPKVLMRRDEIATSGGKAADVLPAATEACEHFEAAGASIQQAAQAQLNFRESLIKAARLGHLQAAKTLLDITTKLLSHSYSSRKIHTDAELAFRRLPESEIKVLLENALTWASKAGDLGAKFTQIMRIQNLEAKFSELSLIAARYAPAKMECGKMLNELGKKDEERAVYESMLPENLTVRLPEQDLEEIYAAGRRLRNYQLKTAHDMALAIKLYSYVADHGNVEAANDLIHDLWLTSLEKSIYGVKFDETARIRYCNIVANSDVDHKWIADALALAAQLAKLKITPIKLVKPVKREQL